MQVVAGRLQEQPPAPQQQQQLDGMPPITLSREELMAAPINELNRMLRDRKIDITGGAGAVT